MFGHPDRRCSLGGADRRNDGIEKGRVALVGGLLLGLDRLLLREDGAVLVHIGRDHALLAELAREEHSVLRPLRREPVDQQGDQVIVPLAAESVVVDALGEQVLLELFHLGPEVGMRLELEPPRLVAQLVHLLDTRQTQLHGCHPLDPQRVDLLVGDHEVGHRLRARMRLAHELLEALDVALQLRLWRPAQRRADPGAGRLGLGVVHVLSPLNGG